MSTIDLHQHLWPEPLVEALRDRTHAPYLRGWTLQTDGEPASELEPADHDVARRVALDVDAGVDLACVSLSAPLGIEDLPADEAAPLLDAWHDGAAGLPDHFAAWASVASREPDLGTLATRLEGGFVGLQLPASDLGGPEAWLAAGEVLRVAELADRPVLVHPGPAPRPVATGPGGGRRSSTTSPSSRRRGGAGTRSVGGPTSPTCAWCSPPAPVWPRSSTSGWRRAGAGPTRSTPASSSTPPPTARRRSTA